MDDQVFNRVARATVRLPDLGGQGVLVPGGLILTAAHCVSHSAEGGMVLGDHYRERVETGDDEPFLVRPLAVEPVCDIAVLGPADDQQLPDDVGAFEDFCRRTPPVPLATRHLEVAVDHPVQIRTHRGG